MGNWHFSRNTPRRFLSLLIKSLRALRRLGGASQGLSSSVTVTVWLCLHNASQTSTFFKAARNGSSSKIKSLIREKWLSFTSAKVSVALKPLIAGPLHSASWTKAWCGLFIYLSSLTSLPQKIQQFFFYEVGTFGSTAGAFCPAPLLQQAELKWVIRVTQVSRDSEVYFWQAPRSSLVNILPKYTIQASYVFASYTAVSCLKTIDQIHL